MLWVRALDARGRARAAGHREGTPAILVAGQPLDRVLHGQRAEAQSRPGAARAQTVTYVLAGTTARGDRTGRSSSRAPPVPSLHRVNAAGGPVEVATTPAAESTGHRHPQFLPGGRQFLFFVGGPDAVRGVYLGALGSSEVTRLLASDTQGAYVAPGWLLFVRQGTLSAQRVRCLATDAQRRADRGRGLRGVRSHRPVPARFRHRMRECMAYRAARPSVTRLSWFDRSGNALGTARIS